MRQMTTLLTSRYASLKLREWVCEQIDVACIPVTLSHMTIESRPMVERHHLVQLAGWLMTDLKPRLRKAWRGKADRYNHMLKDFDEPPRFYAEIVARFSDWRREEHKSGA